MFRRTNEFPDADADRIEYSSRDDFFGDEDGTARTAGIEVLGARVTHVEAQIASQFTSLATYSQIAHEQIELVRGEARHETERNTARVIALVDQERADRLATPSAADLEDRLATIETQITEITAMLQQCLASQSALLDAVTGLVATPLTDPPVAEDRLPAPTSRAGRVHLALA